MTTPRQPRGRVEPKAEPTWLPERKKLEFGKHRTCWWCKGKGKKKGNICGVCNGQGVIDA